MRVNSNPRARNPPWISLRMNFMGAEYIELPAVREVFPAGPVDIGSARPGALLRCRNRDLRSLPPGGLRPLRIDPADRSQPAENVGKGVRPPERGHPRREADPRSRLRRGRIPGV